MSGKKKVKYPKRPKASASLEAWQNYYAKIKEVDRKNADIKSRKKKKESLMKTVTAHIHGVGRGRK